MPSLPAKTVLAVGVEVLARYPAAVLPLDDARIVPAAAAILRRSLGRQGMGYSEGAYSYYARSRVATLS